MEQCDLFRPAAFLPQLHTNRVIVGTWIFSPRNVPCDRKDFLPWSPARFNFSFHELFRHEVRWYVTYKRFLQLTHVESCIDRIPRIHFEHFFVCSLSLSLFFLLNYHSTFRRSMQEKVSLNYTCTKVICLFSCSKHVTFTKKKLLRVMNAEFLYVEWWSFRLLDYWTIYIRHVTYLRNFRKNYNSLIVKLI